MTRDEAIKLTEAQADKGYLILVDALVALGLLKLDEPKSAEEAEFELWLLQRPGWGQAGIAAFLRDLHGRGFKIVKADK